ncbi:hypothetical protein M91_15025 [Bos mutus]|uniref:RING-type domain-containing protein n=1 Tax=Bos mutus TaxID=72004 RepID=L8HNP9_9CETA|nr:hypothetical protein M91_15025 [Bos mutus]
MRLKAQFQSHMNSQGPVEEGGSAGRSKNPSEKPDVFRNNSSSVLRFILSLHCEEDQEVLDGILPMEPSTGLKRQFANDSEDAHDVNAPGKIPKKEADSLPQRNVNSNTGESEELPIEVADFKCALCRRLLFEPVTTPCGHTFCLKCLERCQDHATHCPLCKEKLSELLASSNFNTTALAEELIFRYFSDELSDRESMMKKWWSCHSKSSCSRIPEYDCTLAIKDIRTFSYGGSIIDAVGISRFQVLSHHHRDGYNRQTLNTWKMKGSDSESKSNPSGPAWSWWMLAVLPLAQKAQLATLGMISLKERLLAIGRILVIITRKMNSRQELINSKERNS